MEILAGKVSDELLAIYDEESIASLFTDKAGNYYEYKFEVILEDGNEGFIRFYDSIGRVVPVNFDDIRDVAEMFGRISRFVAERKRIGEHLINALKFEPTWLHDEITEITGEE